MPASPYKPSPLSFGSPRTSPFRRPESPASPSTIRATTPVSSPTKQPPTTDQVTTPTTSPVKPSTPSFTPTRLGTSPHAINSWSTPRGLTPTAASRELPASPTRAASAAGNDSPLRSRQEFRGDAMSRLNPQQLREMRESFQLLDRDGDGQVTREDVVDMLSNLGQDSSASSVAKFFPSGSPQTVSLPNFLNTLATLLAPLSPPTELTSAFEAFDDDDSGQIDLAELRDALLHTSPEAGETPLTHRDVEKVVSAFSGRRAFAKHGVGKKGEVFRYREFVGAVGGGPAVDGAAAVAAAGGHAH
ncbi:MAG: hypothetical protein M1819_003138 [Sarea resinae]|nr:MAG: hypothetical protein M1819_003138 [Sarea resinae]